MIIFTDLNRDQAAHSRNDKKVTSCSVNKCNIGARTVEKL